MGNYFYSIILFVNCVCILTLGLLVLKKNPKGIINRLFFVMTFSGFLYSLSFFIRYTVIPVRFIDNYTTAFILAKSSSFFGLGALIFSTHFLLVFPERKGLFPSRFVNILTFIGTPLLISYLLITNQIVQGMQLVDGNYYIVPGRAYSFYGLLYFGFSFAGGERGRR